MGKRIPPAVVLLLAGSVAAFAQNDKTIRVDLTYQAPGNGPRPDFSPYGTQVSLAPVHADMPLPEGAARPAAVGLVRVGPGSGSWITILVASDADHPRDYCRLYIDRNRNHLFTDDGPPLTATPTQNEKTKAWWSSFNSAEIAIPYAADVTEPYMVNFWAVRETEAPPAVFRYSVGSWRSGKVTVDGVEALVAVMDSDNDALFTAKDRWTVLAAAEPDAVKRVLTIKESRPVNRLMFLPTAAGKELVLEFRGITPDGRSLTFAVVDRPVTKAVDRAPDDTLAAERARPRASHPFLWISSDFDRALGQAKESGRKLILDFWTSWCGPCHTMDDWIWTDAEVASLLNAGYVGVKLDGDLEKALVNRFHVTGYPTIVVLDPSGKEIQRFGYLSSKGLIETLKR